MSLRQAQHSTSTADINADLSHVAERFRLCANILESQAGAAAIEQRAAAWIAVEEMHRLLPTLWRCVR